MPKKLSPTQAKYLNAFIAEYLRAFARDHEHLPLSQRNSVGYAIADCVAGLPLRTRDALIDAGYLEIAGRYSGEYEQRKGYSFGRVRRSAHHVYGGLYLAPTRIGIDWYTTD